MLDREDSLNLLQSGSRTYNMFTYKNQTDNYRQRHYQFHASHDFNSELSIHSSLHYTKGKGYWEEWRKNDPVSNYGFTTFLTGNDTFSSSNLARRKWLDNWWEHGYNYISNEIFNWPVEQVKDLMYGDILALTVQGDIPNHIAVYLDNDIIYHHAVNRLSCRENMYPFWAENIYGIYRSKQCVVKPRNSIKNNY